MKVDTENKKLKRINYQMLGDSQRTNSDGEVCSFVV